MRVSPAQLHSPSKLLGSGRLFLQHLHGSTSETGIDGFILLALTTVGCKFTTEADGGYMMVRGHLGQVAKQFCMVGTREPRAG